MAHGPKDMKRFAVDLGGGVSKHIFAVNRAAAKVKIKGKFGPFARLEPAKKSPCSR